jgi:8-oxo-dGTP pyrophosphatase MutT (NUDIX family)
VTDSNTNGLADHLTTTELLTAQARERQWPNVRPSDAATLILLDRSGKRPKVLMGRRHPGHRFMPDKFVFPGGRIEAGDRAMVAAGALHPRDEQALAAKVSRPSNQRGRALALAAIRETCEETGLLLGTREYGAPEGPLPEHWAEFGRHGVFPSLESLRFVARAITPPRRPKRFDTRFFTADRDAVAAEIPDVVGPSSELIELTWVELAATRDLDLPGITRVILTELEARLAAGMRPELPVPFYREQRGRFVRELL